MISNLIYNIILLSEMYPYQVTQFWNNILIYSTKP